MPSPSSPTNNTSHIQDAALQDITLEAMRSVAKFLTDNKAFDVILYDVRPSAEKSGIGYTDFILVACGSSTLHLKSLWEKVYMEMKQSNYLTLDTEKNPGVNEWLAMDCDTLVIHLFTAAARDYYRFDGILQGYAKVYEEKPAKPAAEEQDASYWERALED